MPIDKKEIARRLKSRREDLRLTQDDVAKAIGIARSTYTRVEGGVNGISAEDLPRYAKALFVLPEYFLKDDPDDATDDRAVTYEPIIDAADSASSKGVLTPELIEETARFLRFRSEEEANKRGV